MKQKSEVDDSKKLRKLLKRSMLLEESLIGEDEELGQSSVKND
jgi:hypothetical protein